MPVVGKRYVAPRKPVPKGKNHPLVCLWLLVDLLYREWISNGKDWDKTLSAIRVLRNEDPSLRADFDEEGNRMTLHTMAVDIDAKRKEWGAH